MADLYSGQHRVYLAKGENTPFSDAAPVVGTDDLAVYADSSGITNETEFSENRPASPWGGELSGIPIGHTSSAQLNLPVYGKGLSSGTIVVPAWAGVILQSFCDLSITTATKETLVITPNLLAPTLTDAADTTTAAATTFTLYEYAGIDGSPKAGKKLLKKMLGCRVTSADLQMNARGAFMLACSIAGLAQRPTDVTTDLSGFTNDGYTGVDSVAGLSAGFQVDSVALRMQQMSVTMATGAAAVEADTTGTGYGLTAVENLDVSGSFTSVFPNLSTLDHYAASWGSSLTRALTMAPTGVFPPGRTANTGYGVKVELPAIQGSVDVDRGSPMLCTSSFKAKRAGVSAAPITITLL